MHEGLPPGCACFHYGDTSNALFYWLWSPPNPMRSPAKRLGTGKSRLRKINLSGRFRALGGEGGDGESCWRTTLPAHRARYGGRAYSRRSPDRALDFKCRITHSQPSGTLPRLLHGVHPLAAVPWRSGNLLCRFGRRPSLVPPWIIEKTDQFADIARLQAGPRDA